jgi:hypothetical protein
LSSFLVNHPISHAFAISVVLCVFALGLILVLDTVIEVFRVLPAAWPPGTMARPRWIVAGFLSLFLYPLSFIVAIGWTGHDGLLLSLPSLAFVAIWRLGTRKRLHARAAEIGLPSASRPSSKRQLLFGAADTKTLKATRFAIGVLAFIGLGVSMPAFTTWTVGDPTSIYGVGPGGATIHPRAYIVAACPASVRKTLHLIGSVDKGTDSYQRWSVVPLPGHLDEVLLDTDSGAVICP